MLYNPWNMSEETPSLKAVARCAELRQRLLALGNSVESLFADAVMTLLAGEGQSPDELRAEDCKVHEQCLEIDALCIELLTEDTLSAPHVRFVDAAARMSADLKRTADECLRIGQSLGGCAEALRRSSSPADSLVRLAELIQGMLGDGMEALVNEDATEAAALHLVFREVVDLQKRAAAQLAGAVSEQKLEPRCAVALGGVLVRLERIANEVLDLCNHVSHLYRDEPPTG